MTTLDTARRYLDAWNARDGDAILATFAPGGTYTDPSTGELRGEAIPASARTLWSAFPDLTFDIVSIAEAGPGRVVAEWRMHGTNKGSFRGLPPTGRAVSLPGVDVFDIGADGITAVQGYFDTRTVPEQLGLQVLVQPFKAGPFEFGYSSSVQSGKKTRPGAFGITTIWNDDAQTEEIRALTRTTATEMLKMEGFIGATFLRVGNRGITLSAWEKPEDMKQLMRGGTHGDAIRKFFAELSAAGYTSAWVPDHFNPMWVRCTACAKMVDYYKNNGACGCGEKLPDPPAWY